MTIGRLSKHSIGLVAIALVGGAAALDDSPVAPASEQGLFSTVTVKSCAGENCDSKCQSQTVPQNMCLPFKSGSVIATCSGSVVRTQFYKQSGCKAENKDATTTVPVGKCTPTGNATSVVVTCSGDSVNASAEEVFTDELVGALDAVAEESASDKLVTKVLSYVLMRLITVAQQFGNFTVPPMNNMADMISVLLTIVTAPPAQPTPA